MDSKTIEQPIGEALDRAEQVGLFAKLPAGFKIDTPLGTYNPDWAVTGGSGGALKRHGCLALDRHAPKGGGMGMRRDEMPLNCAPSATWLCADGGELHRLISLGISWVCRGMPSRGRIAIYRELERVAGIEPA
ncbi:hypothetical protein [Novosphingobium sp. CECT 9465]|uniref:restriction endonuclease n=1 Tax=Novosphingobium sp. CECT 9465 TaxID=2829794 RepID=UPI001E2F6E07|nr:hypothetical protein [Novosphingobium sp. CECT 9465]